jgi:hypothetical protein
MRSIAMASIPIQNETDYTLTDDMTKQIIRDAQEHVGEEVHARTREVRYAFSPQDFGLSHPMPMVQEHSASVADLPTINEETDDAILPVPFEDVVDIEEDEEDTEPLVTSLESLDEGQDDEEKDDFFKLDDPVEDTDEDDEDNIFDTEEDGEY